MDFKYNAILKDDTGILIILCFYRKLGCCAWSLDYRKKIDASADYKAYM